MGVKQCIIGMVCTIIGLSACQATKPTAEVDKSTADINFVKQASRPDWKKQIDKGRVGFYNPADQTLIGLDTPPQTEGYDIIVPNVMMFAPCREYIQDHGSQVAKLEFLVSKKGEVSRFYALKSAGPCDKDVAEAIKESAIHPAQKNDKPKAALVHLRIELKLQGTIR